MLRKLKNYYQNMKPPVKASLWFLICGFLQKGISFLTTPVFTRVMTDAQYGRFTMYNSWFGIVQIIVSLNLAAGVYTRGLVKNEEDQDRFSSSMLGLSTTCVAIWAVLYGLFHNTVNRWLDMSTVIMIAMLVDVWAHAAYQFWSNRERVNYRYKRLVLVTLCYVVLRPVLGLIFVLMAPEHQQASARILTTALVNLGLFAGLYIAVARKGRQFFSKKYWVYALKFNLPLVPHYLSQIVLNQSDRLMIGNICGEKEAAYYSVAYTIAMVLQIINNSISGTMNPWIYKTLKSGDVKKVGKISYYVLALIAAVNLAVVLAAPEILKILAPGSYQSAVWVIPPVTVSVFFMFLYNLFATMEFYFERTHYMAIASVVSAVINVVLNWIFIPRFGFVAAGYTTLVCYILFAAAHYFFMRKVCRDYMDGQKIYDLRIILAISLGMTVCAGLVMALYNLPWIRYGLLVLLLAAAIWKRKTLLGLLRTIKNKA